MIHPHTELRFIDPEMGYGVFATQFIPKGTITWMLDDLDREFTPEEVKGHPKIYRDIFEKYCYRNNKGNYILCWDHGRYVNHSFRSNCLTTAYGFEIATRDIHPGDELTDDYGYLNVDEPFAARSEGTDRMVVYPDDTLRMYPAWDALVAEAFPRVLEVEQPLRTLVPEATWHTVNRVATGMEKPLSILNCYYDPAKANGVAKIS